MKEEKPYFIALKHFDDHRGSLTLLEGQDELLPFKVKRSFWISGISENVKRGGHAHKTSKRILICIAGTVKIELENPNGVKESFELHESNKALLVPNMYWESFEFSKNAVLLCYDNQEYDESDYIRNYEHFLNYKCE